MQLKHWKFDLGIPDYPVKVTYYVNKKSTTIIQIMSNTRVKKNKSL